MLGLTASEEETHAQDKPAGLRSAHAVLYSPPSAVGQAAAPPVVRASWYVDAVTTDEPETNATRRFLVVQASLPGWAVRALAVLLFVAAMTLPWMATHQEVLQRTSPSWVLEPEVVRYRPELVLVPAGRLPSGKGEIAAFYVCRTEVTVGQWTAVVGGTPPNDCAFGCEERHPVTNLSWSDACRYMLELTLRENEVLRARGEPELTPCYTCKDDYCEWSDRACTGFRLPIDEEYEYFARAGSRKRFTFGDNMEDICTNSNGPNVQMDDSAGPCDDEFAGLAPVGSFADSPWSLADVHGNAEEWLWDDFPGSVLPGSTEETKFIEILRFVRGGSFDQKHAGSWVLRVEDPTRRAPGLGFRCVRSASRQSTG